MTNYRRNREPGGTFFFTVVISISTRKNTVGCPVWLIGHIPLFTGMYGVGYMRRIGAAEAH